MNFIELYKQYTFNTESPESFHFWTAVSIIGAALQRKVWVDVGFRVYANLYVVFVAPPGRCRKTQAIRYGEEILIELIGQVNIASDAVTREALIRELCNAAKQFSSITDTGISMEEHSSLTLLSSEFSVFLGQRNFSLLALLCELFDCKSVFTYTTKHAGKDVVRGVWFSLLGATTPEWLLSSLPTTAIGGGLTSRILFIVEHNRRGRVTAPVFCKETKDELVKRLRAINDLEGGMQFGPGAYEFYDGWYQEMPESDSEFRERMHIYVLKLSTIIAAGDHRMEIQKEDIQQAIDEIEYVEPGMTDAFMGVGRSPFGFAISKMLQQLKKTGIVHYDKFLIQHWNDVTIDEVYQAARAIMLMGLGHEDDIDEKRVLVSGSKENKELGGVVT